VLAEVEMLPVHGRDDISPIDQAHGRAGNGSCMPDSAGAISRSTGSRLSSISTGRRAMTASGKR
jgi:hypothetical protein